MITKLTLSADPSAIDPVDQAAAIREVMFLVGGLVGVAGLVAELAAPVR